LDIGIITITFKQNIYYFSLANTNHFLGLARGPIDHNASAVINSISDDAIQMGSSVILKDLVTPLLTSELLPRVTSSTVADSEKGYGIAVGGDIDGIYGDGSNGTFATEGAGEGVVIVTQGRCLARVNGRRNSSGTEEDAAIAVGDKLTLSNEVAGVLFLSNDSSDVDEWVIATALQPVVAGDLDIIAVDVQREGVEGV